MPQVAPAIGALVTSVSAAIAASPLLAAAVQIGAGLVLSAAARALAPRPTSPAQTLSVRAPVVPRDIVYGRVRKGGVMIFAHRTRNGGSDYLHLIYAIAAHEIDAIEKVYFDGREAISDASIGFDGVTERYRDSVIYRTRLGTDGQSAITATHLPTSLWTSAHRCRGVALLYLRLRGEADDFPNGLPNVTVLLRGKNDILDPRTGNRGYTDNAALCLADYMASDRYGLGLGYGTETGIDTASLIAAANVCDEMVTTAGARGDRFGIGPSSGPPERRYACNGVLSSAATPKENVEALLSAMGGKAVYAGGSWRLLAAAYQTPTVALTPGDLVNVSVQTRRSLADNFNAVRGQFVSPTNDWQPDDFPAYRSTVYLAEDQGIESWRDLALPFTTSPFTAQRLAKIELERARRQQVVQVSGMLSAWRAQVGDTVTLTYPRWGWAAKPFEVRKVSLGIRDGALLPDLTLAEVSPLQYDWLATEAEIYAAAPLTDLPDPFEIGPPGSPDVEEEFYETPRGIRTRLRITWGPSPGPFVSYYEVQTRRIETAAGAATGESFRTLVRTDLTSADRDDVATGLWEIRVRAVSTLGRRSDWALKAYAAVGTSAPPVALQGVTLQQLGGQAILTWDLPTDLDVRVGGRIRIRHSELGTPTWANSVSFPDIAGTQTIAALPLKPGAYLLRAVDAGGREGPVVTRSTKGIQVVPFANVNSLVAHPTFAGALTNLQVDELGQLTLEDVTQQGIYEFAGGLDFTAVRAVRSRSVIRMAAVNLRSTIDDRTALIDDWADFDDTDGAFCDVIVEIRTSDDAIAGSPQWSDWTRLDSNEDAFRSVQVRARLISENPDFNVAVSQLAVFFDEVT